MVRYGMSPIEAIRAATVNAAAALDRKDLDVIEAGAEADLIAVAGDPIIDVRVLENVAIVIKHGEIVKDTRAASH